MKTELEHTKVNEKKWDKWSKSLDGEGKRYKFLRQAQKDLIDLLDFSKSLNLLDVGCGTGYALGLAANAAKSGGLFYGVDLSEKMIEKAKQNFNGSENFHFIKSNAESIPLEDNFFDVIISTNSFHHYLHPDKAVKEFYRLLKPAGKLYILDPTADSLALKVIDKIIKVMDSAHVKMYSSKEFQKFFETAGLKYSGTIEIKNHQKVHTAIK